MFVVCWECVGMQLGPRLRLPTQKVASVACQTNQPTHSLPLAPSFTVTPHTSLPSHFPSHSLTLFTHTPSHLPL